MSISPPSGSSHYVDSFIQSLLQEQDIATSNAKMVQPYQVISGSGVAWYPAVKTKTMISVVRGSEILVVSRADKKGRVCAMTSKSDYFWIPEEEVLDIGFN